MTRSIKYLLFTLTITLSLLITACGAGAAQEAAIQTSVAQTVAAQNTVETPNTETPSAPVIPTKTPFQLPTPLTLPTSPTLSPNASKAECAQASLVSDSPVDGIILKPGEQFTKTWEITNTSNCYWDTNYKIVFWAGNVLGGGYVYNLPQPAGPGATIPISLVLTAPIEDGSYRSEWKLQTPDKINFGVGYLNAPFYTEIVVSSAENPDYAVTSMDLYITRDPLTGCPANTTYTAYATFTTNGPLEFTYRWLQQDGNNSNPKTITMTAAGTKTVTRVWKLGRAASQNDHRWFGIEITEPVYKGYPTVGFGFHCP
ncbi:MAG: NBR1-Ig-like domain-containing protein [Anaerolineales bacterium]